VSSPRSSTGIATTAEDPAGGIRPAGLPAGVYRGRFAPSPTGPLHLGSLLAAAGSWLDARAVGGQWLLRIEDIDPPREPPGASDEILRALEAFGLHWDGEVLYQSRRLEAFELALQQLEEAGWTYPCACSRSDISAANRALGREADQRYPGTCREQPACRGKSQVLRVRTTSKKLGVADRLQGLFHQRLADEVGDFVVRRREGLIAYQLAVVVDDAAQGITDVVRGIDLLDSTPRQLWLQRLLRLPTPRYMHLPVMVAPGGEKLSKQTGAAAVDPGRAGALAWQVLACLGQAPPQGLRGAPPAELWAWALSSWQPQQLAGIRSIPVPTEL
jgi:glutamyl-Q tRNA(Asp) synthetase